MAEREGLKIYYKRRLSQSYMIAESDCGQEETYELTILAYNRIPGLLTVETEVADGGTRFWYDISGRQTVSDYLERKLVDSRLLLLLFQSMERMCRELSNYMLWEEHIVLKQEYLYLDFSLEHLEFVYLPGWKQDIRDSFQELMEGILRKLDHNDKQAAAMAYEMYQLSLQREISVYSMIRQAAEAGYLERENEEDGNRGGSEEAVLLPEEKVVSGEEDMVRNGKKRKTKRWNSIQERDGIQRREIRSILGGGKFLQLGSRRNSPLGRSYGLDSSKNQEELPYVTQEQEVLETHPTELLSVQKEIQGILIYQGEGKQTDFKIDKPVFLIGKQKDEVDGYIGMKSVSRIHARIEIVEEDYYLEDLNSTNGTRVNGELMEYRQKMRLKCRDKIAFGREEYIFM